MLKENKWLKTMLRKLYENGFVINDAADNFGMNEEERLVGELAKMQTIMMILLWPILC